MRPTIISRPIIKLVANFTKICSYGLYAIVPGIRFEIPSQSDPLIRQPPRNAEVGIPNIIWQTNYTNRVTLPVYLNYLFNRLMSPTFEYRFMVSKEREAFVRNNYSSDVLRAYERLQIGAAQADFWRLLVLQKYGGVYLDIDAHLLWPLHRIIKSDDSEMFLKIKTGEISNYFVASRPDNANIKDISRQVQLNIEMRASDNVYNLTGPGVFNSVLNDRSVNTGYYLDVCNQGNFTNEYFQYLDKPQGKWTKAQSSISVIRKD